jgi:uncharacterized glyoxalase superfamily protein PhnB
MTTFQGLVPYLYYRDAGAALDWLSRSFGFAEQVRYADETGFVREAGMRVGGSDLMLCGLTADRELPAGQFLIVYIDDVDAFAAGCAARGVEAAPPEDKTYGARTWTVTDPGGHAWCFWQRKGEVQLRPGWTERRSA